MSQAHEPTELGRELKRPAAIDLLHELPGTRLAHEAGGPDTYRCYCQWDAIGPDQLQPGFVLAREPWTTLPGLSPEDRRSGHGRWQ